MKRSFHSLVLAALCAVIIGLPAPAMASGGTGSIAGHLIGGDRPVAGSSVNLYDANNLSIASTAVDTAGAFAFSALRPESYRLEFRTPAGIGQWYHGKTSFDAADEVMVKAGKQTTVAERVLPTGAIAGQLTDGYGNPVAWAIVQVDPVDRTMSGGSATTDPDGRYRIELLPGRYTVSFTVNGSSGLLTQWARQASVPSRATVFAVSAGDTVVIDDTVMRTGSVSGHLVDTAGRALVGASVELLQAEAGRTLGTTTDYQGWYRITALPGTYSLAFSAAGAYLQQWATGALGAEGARAITVVADADTVVDDRLLPTGSVLVTAFDAATHRAIDDFCVDVELSDACSEGSGRALVTGVRQGHQQLNVRTDDGRYFPGQVTADVVGGQTAGTTATLAPAAVITITATDARTGQPVANTCVWPVIRGGGLNSPDWNPESYCSDAQGRVRMSPLPAGSYTLFAYMQYGGEYGAQWVGLRGGTGDQLLAQVVVARAGETTTVAPIKLDGAGTVTGTVRFAATGLPVRLGWASINGQMPDANGQGVYTNILSGDSGRYTLRGLGPYAWPLLFSAVGAAGTWSGDTPNRYLATKVTVTAGATTSYDIALRGGTTVLGTVRDHAGAPAPNGFLIVRNAVTGDPTGVGGISNDGYKLRVLGPQFVKIEYYLSGSGGLRHGWYGGNDQAHATVVGIPAAGTTTVDITLA